MIEVKFIQHKKPLYSKEKADKSQIKRNVGLLDMVEARGIEPHANSLILRFIGRCVIYRVVFRSA